MTNFKDFFLLQESLTKKTNYIKLDEKYIKKQFYCVLVMKDSKLEPHFGVFYENKFDD